ncbi:MAG TPA: 2-C-methyl-D-erythritol 4-phosphate cytidylyltransferase [Burkholderiales bacterium]|nr:2-C-methyl-D-erythritol 4-phosphate cytidylyltransferase [Burkholderiales bacterium]
MSAALFGLIPAAGSGTRLGTGLPKQYLPIAGEAMLVHSIRALARHTGIETVFVVLDADDAHFCDLNLQEFGSRVAPLYCGGKTRRDSVRNGLIAAADAIEADDWVLVHDAARPCLRRADLEALIQQVRQDEVGGLLGVPVADTLKRADDAERVRSTEPRDALWVAQTPQMFRYASLLRALDAAPAATDESSAVEAGGLKPRLVKGSSSNLKVTYAADLAIAEALLKKE